MQPSEEASDNCKFKMSFLVVFPVLNPAKKQLIRPFFKSFLLRKMPVYKETCELLDEYNSRCKAPEPLSSDEQKESTDDGTGDVEKEAQQEGETQEGDGEKSRCGRIPASESQEGAEGQSNEVEGNEETQKLPPPVPRSHLWQ